MAPFRINPSTGRPFLDVTPGGGEHIRKPRAVRRKELRHVIAAHHTVNDKDVRGVDELVRDVMAVDD